MEFIGDNVKHGEFKSKAEEFVRKLVREQKERAKLFSPDDIRIDSDGIVRAACEVNQSTELPNRRNGNSSSTLNRVGERKSTFSLLQCKDPTFRDTQRRDKVSRDNISLLYGMLKVEENSLTTIFLSLCSGTTAIDNIVYYFRLHSEYIQHHCRHH